MPGGSVGKEAAPNVKRPLSIKTSQVSKGDDFVDPSSSASADTAGSSRDVDIESGPPSPTSLVTNCEHLFRIWRGRTDTENRYSEAFRFQDGGIVTFKKNKFVFSLNVDKSEVSEWSMTDTFDLKKSKMESQKWIVPTLDKAIFLKFECSCDVNGHIFVWW